MSQPGPKYSNDSDSDSGPPSTSYSRRNRVIPPHLQNYESQQQQLSPHQSDNSSHRSYPSHPPSHSSHSSYKSHRSSHSHHDDQNKQHQPPPSQPQNNNDNIPDYSDSDDDDDDYNYEYQQNLARRSVNDNSTNTLSIIHQEQKYQHSSYQNDINSIHSMQTVVPERRDYIIPKRPSHLQPLPPSHGKKIKLIMNAISASAVIHGVLHRYNVRVKLITYLIYKDIHRLIIYKFKQINLVSCK